jgi:hypothetical protein
MSDGYTYTTLSARRGEPTQVHVSFFLDQEAWIAVPGIAAGTPHLHISHGHVSVNVGPRTGQLTAEDARIARVLADKTAAYAAEIERLCPPDDPDELDEPDSAAA